MKSIILFTILIVVPIAEIIVLIEIGSLFGTLATILLIVFTAVAGTALIRHQGLGAIKRMRQGAAHNSPNATPFIDGFFLLISGLLLITPGFLTDIAGFILLIPPLRAIISAQIWRRVRNSSSMHTHTYPSHDFAQQHESSEIEGSFVEISDLGDDEKHDPSSPWNKDT